MNPFTMRLASLAVTAALLSGCAAQQETAGQRSANQQLVVGFGYEPVNLDPALFPTAEEATLGITFFEGLLRVGKDGKPEAGAADRWEISTDGTVYTFHMRENAKWSDGKPVTAKDFEYAWMRVLDPAVESPSASMLGPIKNALAYHEGKADKASVGIKALSDSELQVTLEKPTSYFLGLLATFTFAPVRSDIVEKVPSTWSTKSQLLISNGAFHVKQWQHKFEIVAEPNAYYWDRQEVKLSRLTFKLDGTSTGQWADFGDGAIDLGSALPKDLNVKEEVQKGTITSSPYLGSGFMMFNTTHKPFDDPRVRKALGLVIDKQALAALDQSGQTPAGGFVPPGMPDAADQGDFRAIGGDLQPVQRQEQHIAEAKKLLAEAGYPGGQGLPEVSYLGAREFAAEVAKDFSLLGVQLKYTDDTSAIFWNRVDQGDYDLLEYAWIADYSDPINFLEVPANSPFFNIGPAYTQKLQESATILDPAKRFQTLHDAEKLLLDSYGIIATLNSKDNYYRQPYVKDYIRTVRSEPIYRYVSIDEAQKQQLQAKQK
ncbi:MULTISPECIES: peptide ABC transporter substrate-binding protein [Paenibacillus]|uniref:peptide ABC transporter substrate-binding protein n=1 Tax=Paenibacillus TaxID=44249 RepID=UPI0022B8DAF8|nr:peptide ABC transporter substrate-binding protein [Paenibacillus caseinilyticus]MCZ8519845.1 peptide ABC transporter substrate-binding protein [Paenibacillus caseinilyticus]